MSEHTDNPASTPAYEASEDEPQLTKKEKRLGCLYCGVAFFVSYVISAGPAVFVTRRFDLPVFTTVVEFLYFPLILLVKARVPLVSPLIEAWVKIFR